MEKSKEVEANIERSGGKYGGRWRKTWREVEVNMEGGGGKHGGRWR